MKTSKPWNILATILTIVVVLLVGAMGKIEIKTPWDTSFLPMVNAILNTTVAVFIILGGIFIKQGKKDLHRKMMMSAFVISGIFLLCYVAYHLTNGHVYFGDVNGDGELTDAEKSAVSTSRGIYAFILLTHILLAIISFPLILFSIIAAVFGQFQRHKKLTRWAYPMWLYVAITGPVVYLMIRPYY